jgi:hypothetical protein
MNTKWADKQVEYIEKEEDYLRNHKTIIPDALCKLEELRECKEKVISWDEMCSWNHLPFGGSASSAEQLPWDITKGDQATGSVLASSAIDGTSRLRTKSWLQEGVKMERKGLYYTLHRGKLCLRDEEGLVMGGYNEEDLRGTQERCEEAMDPQVLSDTLHWEVISVPIGALSPHLALWLTENFEIRLKKGPSAPPAKSKKPTGVHGN